MGVGKNAYKYVNKLIDKKKNQDVGAILWL